MTLNRNINVRSIYIKHFGSIPVDTNGRTYDIHHIDGNYQNNDISNLKALTIQDHYTIHLEQCDWGACQLIALRLKLSPEEISLFASNAAKVRVQNSTHHFTNSEWQRNNQLKLVANNTHNFLGDKNPARLQSKNGTHPWLGGEMSRTVSRQRVEDGTHNFLGDNNPMHKLVEDGKHPWLGGELQRTYAAIRLEKGILPFGGREKLDERMANGSISDVSRRTTERRMSDGTHHFLGNSNPAKKTIICPHCNKEGASNSFKRWHFDNCKIFTGKQIKHPIVTCLHCSKTGGANNMYKYHFDNCKDRT